MKKKNGMKVALAINGDAADGKSGFRPEIQGGEGGENPNIG